MTVLKGYLIGAVYAAVCLLFSTLLYKLGISKKYTRKTVHILIGFEWIILNHYIGPSYHLLIICLSFLALLIFTYKKGLMQMISSDADNAPGTVYFCVSMSVMSLVSWLRPEFMLPFGIAVFCTSLGDGFAGVVGQAVRRFNPHIWQSKTLFGTLASFIFSFGVCAVFDNIYALGIPLWGLVSLALTGAVLELVTGAGLDNVTLPLGTFLLSYLLIFRSAALIEYIVPVLLTPLLLGIVIKRRILTPVGTAFAVILDLAVSLAFGNMGFLMMALFLCGGVLIDKIKRKFVAEGDGLEKKDDKTRDAYQVLANGALAFVFSALYLAFNNEAFLFAFMAAAAEAFSDTAASGFGSLSRGAFDLFKMRRIEKGMSGGMSLIGTLASLLGAALTALIPFAFGVIRLRGFLLVVICAFSGALFDSFLGSLVQVKYRCGMCGKLTESPVHCGDKCAKVSGISFVNNDAVNFVSSLFASALAIIFYVYLL
ncbi:MAG: DUF92 domain-containing protein [Clostridia bacterium]|nr:DUF92 domain-containing protein [Clostridia bacterium]